MKARLIANPVAGRDAAGGYLAHINERLRAHVGDMDIVLTVSEGDAARAAEIAAQEGYDHLFVGGGDGTLNEVLNGVARVQGGLERVTFGVIPLGTGNDFATALGFPEDVDAALDMLIDAHGARVDAGLLNEQHYFINVSAGGFVAEVSDEVDPQLKTIAGKLAYLIGGAKAIFDHQPVVARIRHGQGLPSRALPLHTFAVCNSRLVGGGRLIAPDAVVDDGRLDICLIEDMPGIDFIALLTRVSNGEHVSDPRVTYFQSPEVELTFDRRIKVNTDGQVVDADRCSYRVLPGAVRVLVPRQT